MFYKILNTQNLIPKTTYDVECLDESREISQNTPYITYSTPYILHSTFFTAPSRLLWRGQRRTRRFFSRVPSPFRNPHESESGQTRANQRPVWRHH